MFCPNCKAEYRPGFTQCNDCQVALVPELPADAERGDDAELVTVFASGKHVAVSLARGILEDAGVEYALRGENVRFLLGAGGSGVGFNPTTGPVRFVVRAEDAERAEELLSQIKEIEASEEEPGQD